MQSLVIYWARRDLRLADNPALTAALAEATSKQVAFLPLFILEDYMTAGGSKHQFGYPSRWFLSEALPVFAKQFPTFLGLHGRAVTTLKALAEQFAVSIHVNDDVYLDFYTQVEKLQAAGVTITVHEDALSVPKDTTSQEGRLYSVFSPFKKSVWTKFVARKPLATADVASVKYLEPSALAGMKNQIELTTAALSELMSKERTFSAGGREYDLDQLTSEPELSRWYHSEAEAIERFSLYLKSGGLDAYKDRRDSLELDAAGEGATSKLSLALAWGLVSARTLLSLTQEHFDEKFDNPFSTRVSQGALTYISELIWREFYRYQLFHHPELMQTEFQARFRGTIEWMEGELAHERFTAWIKGETGYPVVDAAMKQLAATGWMHNRSRMIVASILTKNFGVDWRWGQEYFRAALIDLDEASNSGGWQWGASVGADPKPIRIFNPELQAKNYDRSGAYQERWLGGEVLRAASVPLVEHKVARADALRRYGLRGTEPRDY